MHQNHHFGACDLVASKSANPGKTHFCNVFKCKSKYETGSVLSSEPLMLQAAAPRIGLIQVAIVVRNTVCVICQIS